VRKYGSLLTGYGALLERIQALVERVQGSFKRICGIPFRTTIELFERAYIRIFALRAERLLRELSNALFGENTVLF